MLAVKKLLGRDIASIIAEYLMPDMNDVVANKWWCLKNIGHIERFDFDNVPVKTLLAHLSEYYGYRILNNLSKDKFICYEVQPYHPFREQKVEWLKCNRSVILNKNDQYIVRRVISANKANAFLTKEEYESRDAWIYERTKPLSTYKISGKVGWNSKSDKSSETSTVLGSSISTSSIILD